MTLYRNAFIEKGTFYFFRGRQREFNERDATEKVECPLFLCGSLLRTEASAPAKNLQSRYELFILPGADLLLGA